MSAVFFKAYIKTFLLFPDNTLKKNSDTAFFVKNKLFEMSQSDDVRCVDESQVDVLYEAIKDEDWTKKTMSNYFLLKALYYSLWVQSDALNEMSDKAFSKALSYVDTATLITFNDLKPINVTIKSDIKCLRKEMRKLNANRIKTEKLKAIEPINISPNQIIFIASLFSTLFLVSGIAYIKIFFANFDIAVGNFFSIADYIASSVDILIATVISSVTGVVFLLFGLSDNFADKIRAEQFKIEQKNSNYFVPIIVIVSTIGLVAHSYTSGGELHSFFLYPLIIFLFFELIFRLPFWQYVNNGTTLCAGIVSVTLFSLQLFAFTNAEVKEIKSGNYASSYVLELDEKYEAFSKNEFISANSNYIFLWDSQSEKINIVPKSAMISFHVR
ncbi:hypothetical protein JYT48_02275 [Mariprofundus ferrooxydans]|nr:hypothetical protein [Mariprofundus ferrooxydans]